MNRLSHRVYALLACFSLLFFLPGFTAIPPVDRDEPRFAQASRQMLESGDWVDIRFGDEARNKKPVGIYWLQALSAEATGRPEAIWSYRIPSLLGAVAAVLLTARLGALLMSPSAGFVAALLLMFSLLLNTEARLAKTDAVLLAMVLAAQIALTRIWLAGRAQPTANDNAPSLPAHVWMTFWGAIGCGILLKGPIILLSSGLTILGLCLVEKDRRWLRKLHFGWGVPFALAIAMPWFAAIALRTHGAFFHESVGHDMLGKIAHGQDRGFIAPGLYLLTFPIFFWPGSFAVMAGAPWIWRHRQMQAVRFCLIWAIPFWLCFEVFSTKLPHYMLPICPAFAILGAAFLTQGLPQRGAQFRKIATPLRSPISQADGYRVGAGVWLICSFALLGFAALLPLAADKAGFIPVAGLCLLASLSALIPLVSGRMTAEQSCVALGAAALFFHIALFGLTFPQLRAPWLSSRITAELPGQKDCPLRSLATLGYDEPSLMFLTDARMQSFGNADLMLEYLAASPAPPRCRLALVSEKHAPDFGEALQRHKDKAPILAHIAGLNYGHGAPVSLTLHDIIPDGYSQ